MLYFCGLTDFCDLLVHPSASREVWWPEHWQFLRTTTRNPGDRQCQRRKTLGRFFSLAGIGHARSPHLQVGEPEGNVGLPIRFHGIVGIWRTMHSWSESTHL